MFTNRTLNSLTAKVESLEDKIKANEKLLEDKLVMERQVTNEQQDKLQKSYDNLGRELSELKGGTERVNLVFTILSIVLALLIGLTGLNFIKYQHFETVRRDVYDILGDVFQGQLADAIDQLVLVSPPTEQERLANKLSSANSVNKP